MAGADEAGHRSAFEQSAEDRQRTHRQGVEGDREDLVLPQRYEGPRHHLCSGFRARPGFVSRFQLRRRRR